MSTSLLAVLRGLQWNRTPSVQTELTTLTDRPAGQRPPSLLIISLQSLPALWLGGVPVRDPPPGLAACTLSRFPQAWFLNNSFVLGITPWVLLRTQWPLRQTDLGNVFLWSPSAHPSPSSRIISFCFTRVLRQVHFWQKKKLNKYLFYYTEWSQKEKTSIVY